MIPDRADLSLRGQLEELRGQPDRMRVREARQRGGGATRTEKCKNINKDADLPCVVPSTLLGPLPKSISYQMTVIIEIMNCSTPARHGGVLSGVADLSAAESLRIIVVQHLFHTALVFSNAYTSAFSMSRRFSPIAISVQSPSANLAVPRHVIFSK